MQQQQETTVEYIWSALLVYKTADSVIPGIQGVAFSNSTRKVCINAPRSYVCMLNSISCELWHSHKPKHCHKIITWFFNSTLFILTFTHPFLSRFYLFINILKGIFVRNMQFKFVLAIEWIFFLPFCVWMLYFNTWKSNV